MSQEKKPDKKPKQPKPSRKDMFGRLTRHLGEMIKTWGKKKVKNSPKKPASGSETINKQTTV